MNEGHKVAYFDVYKNIDGEITILDTRLHFADSVSFDECMAEKLCKAIMKVAKEIREEEGDEEK